MSIFRLVHNFIHLSIASQICLFGVLPVVFFTKVSLVRLQVIFGSIHIKCLKGPNPISLPPNDADLIFSVKYFRGKSSIKQHVMSSTRLYHMCMGNITSVQAST